MPQLRVVRRITREALRLVLTASLDLSLPRSELLEMLRSLGEEEGELEFLVEELVDYDPRVHQRLFTRNVIRLLEEVGRGVDSVTELARRLGRDVANVYRDLKWLESLGMVTLVREGRRLRPVLTAVEYGIIIG